MNRIKQVIAFIAFVLIIVGAVAGIGGSFAFGNILLGICNCVVAVAVIPTEVRLYKFFMYGWKPKNADARYERD